MSSIEDLNDNEELLWKELKSLHYKLRKSTKMLHNRVNPFVENLFQWEEKGKYFGSKGTRIYDSATIMGDVKLGDNVWIGPFCMVDGTGGLKIGDYVDMSTGVKIFTHDTVKRALTGGIHEIEYAPVSIGNYTFIGSDTVILKGVEIGDQCVIAANSLVNKSFPDRTIIGGVPAKKIGTVEIENSDVHLKYENEE